jgi:hypothetical protein
MANKIPLNLYKRVTKEMSRRPQLVYKAPKDVASTIISFLGTNTTDKNRTMFLSLTSAQEKFVTLFDYELQPFEFTNLLPSKMILMEDDGIEVVTDIEDTASINDEGLFWLYRVPTQSSSAVAQINLRVLSPTEVTINWGDADSDYSSTVIGDDTLQNVSVVFVNNPLETGVNVTLSILESINTQNA